MGLRTRQLGGEGRATLKPAAAKKTPLKPTATFALRQKAAQRAMTAPSTARELAVDTPVLLAVTTPAAGTRTDCLSGTQSVGDRCVGYGASCGPGFTPVALPSGKPQCWPTSDQHQCAQTMDGEWACKEGGQYRWPVPQDKLTCEMASMAWGPDGCYAPRLKKRVDCQRSGKSWDDRNSKCSDEAGYGAAGPVVDTEPPPPAPETPPEPQPETPPGVEPGPHVEVPPACSFADLVSGKCSPAGTRGTGFKWGTKAPADQAACSGLSLGSKCVPTWGLAAGAAGLLAVLWLAKRKR